MLKKVEVVKSYLDLLNIDFDFSKENVVKDLVQRQGSSNYIFTAKYESVKLNKKQISVEKEHISFKAFVSNDLVTIHYNDKQCYNYELIQNTLDYNWMTLVSTKIAYFFADKGNLVMIVGENKQHTLCDDLGNQMSPMKPVLNIDDTEIIVTKSISINEDVELTDDISELIRPHLKGSKHFIYQKI